MGVYYERVYLRSSKGRGRVTLTYRRFARARAVVRTGTTQQHRDFLRVATGTAQSLRVRRFAVFLDIYYQGANALCTEQDFNDLTGAYLKRCKAGNVIHTGNVFDPQAHTDRGIGFETVINGIHCAMQDGNEQLDITSKIIAYRRRGDD